MDEKQRVKDLSTELGVTNKELIQACRELDIPVKSHMSALTDEQAGEVKTHLTAQSSSTEVVRKEVQPGMVVRRRRKKVREKAAPAVEADVEAPAEAKEAPASDASAPEATPEAAPEAVAEAPAEPVEEAPVEAKPKKAPAKKAPKKKAEPKARIIQPVEEAAAEPEVAPEPVAEPAEPEQKEANPAKAAKADKVEEEQAAPAEAETVEAEDEAKPAKAKKAAAPKEEKDSKEAKTEDGKSKKKTEKKAPGAKSQVRIISMPDPNAPPTRPAPAARPTRRPGGRPGGRPSGPGGAGGPGGRPGGPPGGRPGGPGGRPGGPAPGGPGGPGRYAPPAPPKDGAPTRKRKRKDKRVVEFGPNYRRDDRKFGGGKKGKKGKRGMSPEQSVPSTQPLKAAKRKVKIEEAIRVADMAKQMGLKAQALIKVLFGLGVMATINQSLDFDTAVLVASEFGYEVEKVGFSEEQFLAPTEAEDPKTLKPRAPVVTIMGHVDHGKTSLLDAIRESKITSGEAGGITQHIGAYDVRTERGKVVFLDTPGHEAFTAMRARGAQVTDLVILVVAADDGVMDQTREAINHSKAAGVPIIVAVNKIDKEAANPERVMRELAEFDLVPEDWGGETIFVNVSAKTGENLDTLLEMVLLQAEVLELKANPDKAAVGHIVEARLDKGRGPVATVLIEGGTLKQGDAFVCGVFHGKVRGMLNDHGRKMKKAGPAVPVEVQGFDGIPEAGDTFTAVKDDKVARRIAQSRAIKHRERALARESKVTLESFLASSPDNESQSLNLVLKSDVQGSLEAITEALVKLSTDAVKIDIVHGGAGAITESDILLAAASQAIIIGFNVRPTAKIKEVAEQENVDIRFYDIIYKLVSEIKDAMTGMLAPVISEKYLGQAEVRETFGVPKVGTVAGCYVVDGELKRNAGIRLLREGVVIYTGSLASLRRFKDDVKEVRKGYECGAGLEKFNDIKVGDVIEAFEEVETAATLD